jgi:hypothetical protein
MELRGFDQLIAICHAFGMDVRLNPPATALPGEVHGQPLDPQLAALLRRANGAYLRGRNWEHYINSFGKLRDFGGPEDLDNCGGTWRLLREDWPRIGHFILFGKYGWQATYEATVPALAAADGTQPVVDVDIHEDLRVTPLASSVDRWLHLTVRFLERAGSDKGTSELLFPEDVSDVMAEDSALVALLKAGAFAPFVGEDRYVLDFIAQVIKAHDSNGSRLRNGGDGE